MVGWRASAPRTRMIRTLEGLLILAALATIPLVLAEQQGVVNEWITWADWIVWAIFVAELAAMLSLSDDRRAHLRENWLSLAVIVFAFPVMPDLLRLAGLERLARLFLTVRLMLVCWRVLGALRFAIGRRRFVYVGAVALVIVLAGGSALAILEPETVEGGFWDGVWWGVVTVTTVGYGDITPKTPAGRLVGVLLMATGIGLVSTVAASLAARFVEEDVKAEQREIEQRLRRMADHIVICGLGRKGSLLAGAFLDLGHQVVAIERDMGHPGLIDLRERGAIILVGDATDSALLHRARVMTADGLVAVCGDDDANADIIVHADGVVRARTGEPLKGLAHIVDPLLCDLFKKLEVGAEHTGGLRLQFFNVYDGAARALLQAFPPFALPEGEATKPVLVVGLGQLGQRVVFNLGRNWREQYLATGDRLTVALVDPAATQVRETLLARYPHLDAACDLRTYPMEYHSAAFHQGGFLAEAAGPHGLGVVYVALGDDAASLSAALELRQKIREVGVTVVACMSESTGLVKLLDGMDGTGNRVEGLRAFRVLEQTCTPSLLLDSANETLARAHHEDFMRRELALGHTRADNPSIVPWEQLSEEKRDSSRQAVDHIPVKLHAVGCDIEPMIDWDAELFEFAPREVELLAEMEHLRWLEERSRAGFTYGPVRDDSARVHPDLQPWNQLSAESQEKNRASIRGLPAYLASVGFQIVRRS
jgi:voltage-gated potassium channel Kch